MLFENKSDFVGYVKTTVVPQHNSEFRGKRKNGRKAREVKEQKAEQLADIAWDNRDEADEVIIKEMKETYGFIEYLIMGWQIYQLIMQIITLLKAQKVNAATCGATSYPPSV